MVLSYYSYAKSLSLLTKYNKDLGNQLFECQQNKVNYKCKCWLDYFLIGNVWSVGFGLDVSEFDVWWAIERKSREIADKGYFKAYFGGIDNETNPQKILLSSMQFNYQFYPVINDDYSAMYRKIIDEIKTNLLYHDR